MEIPDPDTYGDDLHSWTDAVAYAMHQYPSMVAMAPGDDDWQGWGMVFFNNPSLAALNPPNPYMYDSWVDWGERLADALNNAPDAPPFPGSASGGGKFLIAQTGAYIMTQLSQFIMVH